MKLFDTHINMHAEQFSADADQTLNRARTAGVTRFITICDRLDRFADVRDFAVRHSDVWCTVGVHPHYAKDFSNLAIPDLQGLSDDPRVVGIGETGIDLHYGFSAIEAQIESFRTHIAVARATGLPLIVHTREADDVTGDVLEDEFTKGAFRILMHCFTSGQKLAERALAMGAWFSVSGILSFPKAKEVRQVISAIPLNKIVLETDCPYLAPVPHRGRRNEPAFLVDVCRAFADLRGMDTKEAAELTTRNGLALFERVS